MGVMAHQSSLPGNDSGPGLHRKAFRRSWPNLVPGRTNWFSGLHMPLPHLCLPIWLYILSQPGAPRQACPLSFPRPKACSLSSTQLCKTGQTNLLVSLTIPHSLQA